MLFVLFTILFGCMNDETSVEKQKQGLVNKTVYSVEDSIKERQRKKAELEKFPEIIRQIQGDWTCVKILERDYRTEAVGPFETNYPEPQGNLRIEMDSVWLLDYPCQFYFSSKIKLLGKVYGFKNDLRAQGSAITEVNIKGQQLVLYQNMINLQVWKYYLRDTLETKKVKQLIKDSININCLKGEWTLITHYDPGYDGTDGVYHFPFKIPQKLDYTQGSTLNKLVSNKRFIEISVNGKPENFYISQLSTKIGNLWVLPYGWWKGADDYSDKIRYSLKKR